MILLSKVPNDMSIFCLAFIKSQFLITVLDLHTGSERFILYKLNEFMAE